MKEFGAVVSHEIMDEKFSVPTDEFHATSEAFGSRLLTGTQEGSLAAFSIERRGDSYQVVRLGKQALAWELSKIVLAWGLVAFVLFAALFGVAEKFRRQKRSSIRK